MNWFYMPLYFFPKNGDLWLKYVGEFMCMDDLQFYINCVHLSVYNDDYEVISFKISLIYSRGTMDIPGKRRQSIRGNFWFTCIIFSKQRCTEPLI